MSHQSSRQHIQLHFKLVIAHHCLPSQHHTTSTRPALQRRRVRELPSLALLARLSCSAARLTALSKPIPKQIKPLSWLTPSSPAMTALHPSSLSNEAPGAAGMTTSAAAGQASQVSGLGGVATSRIGLNGVKAPEMASRFLQYSDASPTPFHAVATSAKMLEAAGFTKLREADVWDGAVERNGKYYFTRNESALVAFAVGGNFTSGQGGVHIVGGHTDSPNFHIKPISKREKAGYLQVRVESYGGGLWHTWFDRDLTLAGRVIVQEGKGANGKDQFKTKLVHVKRPLLRIPTLAIHLDRGVAEGFKFNKEEQTIPIMGLANAAEDALNAKVQSQDTTSEGTEAATGTPIMTQKHHSVLLDVLAQELGCPVAAIQDFELSLADTQHAALGGVHNEFIFAPRLDNQMTCFCATTAMINAHGGGSEARATTLSDSKSIRAIALFDNEEVGSVSTHGAESNILASLVRRLSSIRVISAADASNELGAGTSFERAIQRSFLISSDMAHGFHPNYANKYEDEHRPKLNGGVVIKTNTNQRYASTGPTTFLTRRLAKRANVPLQEFVVRNDMPCGSTIGPMMSKTGIRTIDLGSPQLSMHSIRETCGSHDVDLKIRLFETFFNDFEQVDAELTVD